MTSAPFTPYWKNLGHQPVDPYSWVFFVVAQIAGRHRPVAVVSSLGDTSSEELTLQGYPLTAACQRIVTIFADPTNHRAILGELALAADYYMRDGDCEYRPNPVELPEFSRRHPQPVVQPVAAFPESLGTVYRDTSVDWGMVVVDVTKLDEVRYGIVGFAAWEMMFITSAAAELRLAAAHFFFLRGELRVMDELRPRSAMSAAEYRAKFKNNHTIRTYYNDNVSKQLARVPLIDEAAMDLVWPLGLDGEDEILPSLASLSVGVKVNRSLPDQAITSLIQSILDLENFNMSIFDHVRSIPNFQDLLRNNLVQHSARLCSTRSAGQLIRLAFADQEHLSLEQLKSLSAEAISAALGVRGMREVMSISLCIDSLRSTPAQLIDVLSRADNLREIYFLQNPIREGNALSVQLFEELAARSQILKRAKVILAGAFSAALHKRLWLPRIPIPRCMPSDISDVVQVAPLDVFPVQQMFVRYQIGDSIFKYKYVHLGDALLKPERFAAGFLLYLRSLVPSLDEGNKEAQLFSFSSAPSSLAADTLTSAEVSTIPAESFSSRKCAQCWPRDLVRGGWTVIVSQESHYPRRGSFYSIRYAFVRACQQRIMVDLPPLTPPSPDQLQVVGLKEFLGFTASEVDPDVVDCRLHAVAEHLVACEHQGTPGTRFPGIEPVSVLSHAEAADILLRFLFLNMLEK